MEYQQVLFIIMQTIFLGYISFIVSRYGVLSSISDSWYMLPKNQKPLFTLVLWGFALPAIIIGECGLMFLAGSGIAFVGAAAAFKDRMTKTVHFSGAAVGILSGELAIIINFQMWWIAALFGLGSILMILTKIKNKIWWIEILAFASISLALGIEAFK